MFALPAGTVPIVLNVDARGRLRFRPPAQADGCHLPPMAGAKRRPGASGRDPGGRRLRHQASPHRHASPVPRTGHPRGTFSSPKPPGPGYICGPGPAQVCDARPGSPAPVWGSGGGVVARCRRPRQRVGSQPGHIGWRLGRRAALGRQHNRNVTERGALTQRNALVCRAYRRQAIGVVGPVWPHYDGARWSAGWFRQLRSERILSSVVNGCRRSE